MRIVIDLQACQASSKHRGIGRYSMSLAKAIARQAGSHELQLVLNGNFPDTVQAIRNEFDGLVAPEHIRTFDVPTSVAAVHTHNVWRHRAAEYVREAYLNDIAPDVVHVSSLFEGLSDDAVASIGNLPANHDTAVTLYDLIPFLRPETYLVGQTVREWYFRKLQSLKRTGLLLAISNHSRREAIEALQLCDDQIINISSAVEGAFGPRELSDEYKAGICAKFGISRPFLMYTGGIDYRKNIDGLIEAYALLPAALRQEHQLAIVCKIEDSDRIRLGAHASRLGLREHEVVFTGFVTDDELLALYNLTRLFVFPSLQEGFGLPVLEAMSCGAVVIGSNTSSIPEVIGRDDALFNPSFPLAICGKMQQALTDEGLRASLQEHGLRQSKLFSWDASGKRAIEGFEQIHSRSESKTQIALRVEVRTPRSTERKKLAFISPLPPEQSGIADYSAELLRELGRYYDIDVIVAQESISDPWVAANHTVRDVTWFDRNAHQYQRILYHFGNSAFHLHMFGLLQRHPGMVVLHDFYMSGVLNYGDSTDYLPGVFQKALYGSHGYRALVSDQRNGRTAAIYQYPCNRIVLDHALGVIVHSRYSMTLATQWYGPETSRDWRCIPLLKGLPVTPTGPVDRSEFHFSDHDFVICSFGMVAPTKLNHRLLDAWLDSPLARDERCHLVFVGDNALGEYGVKLEQAIAQRPGGHRVKFTGFASVELYRKYLTIADVAVQLRTSSRGETSASVLDCLAYGLPTIINANGSAAELPSNILFALPDDFSDDSLSSAMLQLWRDPNLRKQLGKSAQAYVASAHHPANIADQYVNAIEEFATQSAGSRYRKLLRSIADIDTQTRPSENDLLQLASNIAVNRPRSQQQILIDISKLLDPRLSVESYAAGTQWLRTMLMDTPEKLRIEPIAYKDGCYHFARRATTGILGVSGSQLLDSPIEFARGDSWISLEFDHATQGAPSAPLQQLANASVAHFVLHIEAAKTFVMKHFADHADRIAAMVESLRSDGDFVAVSRPKDSSKHADDSTRSNHIRHELGILESDFVLAVSHVPDASHTGLLHAWTTSGMANDTSCHLLILDDSGAPITPAYARIQRVASSGNMELANILSIANLVISLHGYSPNRCNDWLAMSNNQCTCYLVWTQSAPENSGRISQEPQEAKPAESIVINDGITSEIEGAPLEVAMAPEQGSINLETSVHAATPSTVERNVTRERPVESRLPPPHISRYVEKIGYQSISRVDGSVEKGAISIISDAPDHRPQMLIDISVLCQGDAKTGIQRVVRSILLELLASAQKEYRIEPIREVGGYYSYARNYVLGLLGEPEHVYNEPEPISVRKGDVFLGLDLFLHGAPNCINLYLDLKRHGIQMYYVVFDLLPLQRPEVFEPHISGMYKQWLDAVIRSSDGLLCISRSVADELALYVQRARPTSDGSINLAYFHLGSDITHNDALTPPVTANPLGANVAPETILMVGTIEPRKGHAQALKAMEILWQAESQVQLIIVGKQGWMVEELAERLRTHREIGKRLFWLDKVEDKELQYLYQNCSVLLIASEGEGFGLPLVEAAQYGLPILARDLPVFHEVAGHYASYFSGMTGERLALAIQHWFTRRAQGEVPGTKEMPRLSWAESTSQLLEAIRERKWYRSIPPEKITLDKISALI